MTERFRSISGFSLLRDWVRPNRQEKGSGVDWFGSKSELCLRLRRDFGVKLYPQNHSPAAKISWRVSLYTPILFPAGKGLCRPELPTRLHSGGKRSCCDTSLSIVSPAGKELASVAVTTRCLSDRQQILQGRARELFCAQ